MAKFRKRPIIIEAEQFLPHDRILPFVRRGAVGLEGGRYYVVTAHNQKAYLDDGDWVIAESDGEHFYPCKPDIFSATYDLIEA